MPVKLIAHVLLTVADSHLMIQRSQIKRGEPAALGYSRRSCRGE
ncbi:MutT/NudX family protein () [Streptococcus suis]|nr:MutT/NudX family protein () [Streptococcus suis]